MCSTVLVRVWYEYTLVWYTYCTSVVCVVSCHPSRKPTARACGSFPCLRILTYGRPPTAGELHEELRESVAILLNEEEPMPVLATGTAVRAQLSGAWQLMAKLRKARRARPSNNQGKGFISTAPSSSSSSATGAAATPRKMQSSRGGRRRSSVAAGEARPPPGHIGPTTLHPKHFRTVDANGRYLTAEGEAVPLPVFLRPPPNFDAEITVRRKER